MFCELEGCYKIGKYKFDFATREPSLILCRKHAEESIAKCSLLGIQLPVTLSRNIDPRDTGEYWLDQYEHLKP